VAFTCVECGAIFTREGENCASRFEELLALDHSRTEPWGSRHGLAFSAFALQHPQRFLREVLERAWILLFKVYREGAEPKTVTNALKRLGKQRPKWAVPALPDVAPDARYNVTIASLGSFEAESYPQQLDAWCRAALEAWSGKSPAGGE
jgi:hypothetical protein